MTTTPADPGAIDLKAIQSWSTQIAPIPNLIAAVEALRERLKGWPDPNDHSSLQRNRDSWMRACEAAEARVAKLEADLARCKTAQALAKLDALGKEGP